MTTPSYLSQAAYARLRGWAKSHVTKLKHADRLVFTPRGLVDVAASDARIADTGGLRPDVAERQADRRAPGPVPALPVAPAPAAGPAPDPDPAPAPTAGSKGSAASELRRRREETKRQTKLIELGLLRGALLERAAVDHAAADLGVTLRATLDAAVERLAPRLAAARDAGHIAALTARELSRERRRINRALVRAARDLTRPE